MKIFCSLIFIFCSLTLLAQKEIELEFDNGEKKTFSFDYDDPEVLPKWAFDIKFFGLMSFRSEAFSYRLNGIYRINYKWMLDAQLAQPFARSVDGNASEGAADEYGARMCRDWSLTSRHIVSTAKMTKVKKIAVDFSQSGNVQTVYSAKLPRVMDRSLSIDGGIGRYNYYHGGKLTNLADPSENPDTVYELGNVAYTTLNLGLSMFKSESYKMKTDGNSRSYWRTGRLYGNLSIGIKSTYEVNMLMYDQVSSGSSLPPYVADVKEGFGKPSNIALGWRLGYQKHMGIKNTGGSGTYGIEIGGLPRIKNAASAKMIFMFHIGFGFGAKPKKL